MPRAKAIRGQVIGIGGIFFKSNEPERLDRWYERPLGVVREKHGAVVFAREMRGPPRRSGATVWGVFPRRTRYFSTSRSPFMVTYRVDDLEALLTRLRRSGVRIDPKRQNEPYGKFAWVRDRDGNRLELREPRA